MDHAHDSRRWVLSGPGRQGKPEIWRVGRPWQGSRHVDWQREHSPAGTSQRLAPCWGTVGDWDSGAIAGRRSGAAGSPKLQLRLRLVRPSQNHARVRAAVSPPDALPSHRQLLHPSHSLSDPLLPAPAAERITLLANKHQP